LRIVSPLLFLTILILSNGNVVTSSFAAAPQPFLPLHNEVDHAMTVRVAMVGITGVDQDELLWNLEPEIQPTIQMSHNPQGLSELVYGTRFTLKYEINWVPAETTSAFKEYLKSIARSQKVPKYLQGYQHYNWWKHDGTTYATIDALKTETYLDTNLSDFGGIPNDGYLLIVANVPDMSPMYHYYNVSYGDIDNAASKARYHDRPEVLPIVDWMYSWGGHHGFYFLDLSAGDPEFDYSMTGHIPIQSLQNRPYYDEKFKQTVHTTTEYVADYVAEAVRNLFVPSYAYAPTFAPSYKVAISIFDQTGKVSESNAADYLSGSLVKRAFENVIPYATWDVTVQVRQLSDDDALEKVVSDSILYSEDTTGLLYDEVHRDYYDYRPVYQYLQKHASQYYDTAGAAVVLPVFEFILKGGGLFADTQEESISHGTRTLNGLDRTFGGISLGDMVIIGRSEKSVFDYGYELTQVTIHELGHSIGLMHPHAYGKSEDYVSSAMSYMTYEYEFSQFDVDAIQRAHADLFLSQVQIAVQSSTNVAFQNKSAQDALKQAKSAYEVALNSYSEKDYAQATKALQNVSSLLDEGFETEVRSTEDKISQTPTTSETGQTFQERAKNLVKSAQEQKAAGNLGMAYQLLAEASTAVSNATQAEQQAQRIKTLQDELPIYAIVSLVVGLLIGCAVMWLMLRRKRELPASPAQETSPVAPEARERGTIIEAQLSKAPSRSCVSCRSQILQESIFCEHCGARQPDLQQ